MQGKVGSNFFLKFKAQLEAIIKTDTEKIESPEEAETFSCKAKLKI